MRNNRGRSPCLRSRRRPKHHRALSRLACREARRPSPSIRRRRSRTCCRRRRTRFQPALRPGTDQVPPQVRPVDEKADKPRPIDRKDPDTNAPPAEQTAVPVAEPQPDIPLNARQAADMFWEDYAVQCSEEDRANVGGTRKDQEHVLLARIAALM